MLNFDADRYVRIQAGAVALAGPIDEIVKSQIAGGCDRLFFLATGGVAFLMQPAARVLQTRSTFRTYVEGAAELLVQGSVNLGASSLVVVPSRSGTTKETLAAVDFVRERGAHVLGLAGTAGSVLGERSDTCLVNEADDDTSSESYYLQSLLIALSVMRHNGEFPNYESTVAELALLPELLVDVKRAYESWAVHLADEIKSEQHHFFTSAGGSWYEAWYFAMCILEEMQWVWTRPVHASDFFHGALELVEADTSLFLLKGEDECRPLVDRVERFARTVSNKVRVLDAAEMDLPGISQPTRALISPILLAAVLERLAAHLEVDRNHPLTTRRYYKKGDF